MFVAVVVVRVATFGTFINSNVAADPTADDGDAFGAILPLVLPVLLLPNDVDTPDETVPWTVGKTVDVFDSDDIMSRESTASTVVPSSYVYCMYPL